MNRTALVLLSVVTVFGCDDVDDPECVFNRYELTVMFEGFNEHVGQLFELRTAKPGTMELKTVQAIPGPEFSVEVLGRCDGEFDIDFYADVNGNGDYDPPPTDHAWRIVVADQDNDFVNVFAFPHDANHVDIEWPH